MTADWEQYRVAGNEALQAGDFGRAEHVWRAALAMASNFHEMDARVCATFEGLSEALWQQGRYSEAEDFCRRVLSYYQTTRRVDHPDLGVTYSNLAMLAKAQINFKEAEDFFEKAMAILAPVWGDDHPDVLQLLANYADILHLNGKVEKAQELEATSRRATFAAARSNEGEGYQQPALEDASKRIEKSLERQRMLDEQWERYRRSGERSLAEGDFDFADKVWRLAAGVAEQFPTDDPRNLITFEKHCEVFWRLQQYSEAEPLCRKALEFYERTLGPNHPDAAISMTNLAMLCHAQGKLDDAEPLYRRALPIRVKALGAEDPQVVSLISNYSALLIAAGKHAEAEKVNSVAQSVASGRWTRSGQFRAFAVSFQEQLFEPSQPQAPTPVPPHSAKPTAPPLPQQRQTPPAALAEATFLPPAAEPVSEPAEPIQQSSVAGADSVVNPAPAEPVSESVMATVPDEAIETKPLPVIKPVPPVIASAPDFEPAQPVQPGPIAPPIIRPVTPRGAIEPVPAPIGDPIPPPAPEPIAEPIPPPAPEPIAEPIPPPAPEPIAEPIPPPAPEPIAEPIPPPAPEPIAAPIPPPAPEPIAEPIPPPAPEPIAEPIPPPAPEPIAEPIPPPAPEPIAEPIPPPAPEPIAEPIPPPAPEPIAISPISVAPPAPDTTPLLPHPAPLSAPVSAPFMRHRSWEECRADADAALESGEYEQAEILWLEAFEISRHFEEGDPRQCLTMESLAETFWKGAKYADAIDICHVLLPIYERRLGNDHIDVATIITNLGMLNHALKNFDRAEAHYKRSLQILMGKTGPAPPELTRVITNYALMLCSTGRTAEGEALKARVRRMNTGKWNRVGYFEALKVEEPASFTDTVGEQAQYLQKLD